MCCNDLDVLAHCWFETELMLPLNALELKLNNISLILFYYYLWSDMIGQ